MSHSILTNSCVNRHHGLNIRLIFRINNFARKRDPPTWWILHSLPILMVDILKFELRCLSTRTSGFQKSSAILSTAADQGLTVTDDNVTATPSRYIMVCYEL